MTVSPPERADWTRAMLHEIDHLPTGISAARWACGCLYVSYTERMRRMSRISTRVSRWIVSLELLMCFVPLTVLLGAVLYGVVQGSMPRPQGLVYASCALTGPFGLIVGFRILLVRDRAASRMSIAVLAILAGWTLFTFTGAVLRNDGLARLSEWWRDFILIALLPTLAVLHLARIRARIGAAIVPLDM